MERSTPDHPENLSFNIVRSCRRHRTASVDDRVPYAAYAAAASSEGHGITAPEELSSRPGPAHPSLCRANNKLRVQLWFAYHSQVTTMGYLFQLEPIKLPTTSLGQLGLPRVRILVPVEGGPGVSK